MSRRSSKVVRVVTAALLGVALAGPVVTPLVAEESSNSTQGTLARTNDVIDYKTTIQCKDLFQHQWEIKTVYKTIAFHTSYSLTSVTNEEIDSGHYCRINANHNAVIRKSTYHYKTW